MQVQVLLIMKGCLFVCCEVLFLPQKHRLRDPVDWASGYCSEVESNHWPLWILRYKDWLKGWEGNSIPIPVHLLRKSHDFIDHRAMEIHGDRQELDTIKQLTFTFYLHVHWREWQPLQYSAENLWPGSLVGHFAHSRWRVTHDQLPVGPYCLHWGLYANDISFYIWNSFPFPVDYRKFVFGPSLCR